MGSVFGASASGSPNVWQPAGTAQADTNYQNLTNNMATNNPYTQYTPQAVSTFNQAYNNPYASGFQSAANTAGGMYGSLAPVDTAASQQMTTAGNTGMAAANQVLNTAYDPRNALYNQQYGQMQQANLANQAASGTGSSPYGASVTNQADTNFNTSWQAQQLANQIAGLGAYTSGAAGANADYGAANTLGTQGAQAAGLAGNVPYAAAGQITSDQTTALQNLMAQLGTQGAGAWDQNTLAALQSYLGLSASQSNQEAQLVNQATEAAQSGVGSLLGAGIAGGSNILASYVAPAAIISDSRIKERIIPAGMERGYPIYEFSYLWNKAKRYIGVMAQDILRLKPEAVVSMPNGYYAVRYDLLGVKFREA